MVMIEKKKIFEVLTELPENCGIINFYQNNKPIYSIKTSNIATKFSVLRKNLDQDKYLFKMFSLTDKIDFIQTENLFIALLLEKLQIAKFDPDYNHLIKHSDSYSYLEINFDSVPFFKTASTTIGNGFYIGPFRNSFFIHDFLTTMNLVAKFPLCQDHNYPCDLFAKGNCHGYCIKDKSDFLNMVKNNYLTENEDLVRSLNKQKRGLDDELKFERADLIRQQSRIIEKYYRYLRFFHVAKNLNGEFKEDKRQKIFLEHGLLSGYDDTTKKWDFPIIGQKHRSNEFLAVDKTYLDEMWIIYNHLQKDYIENFIKIYLKSIDVLLKLLAA